MATFYKRARSRYNQGQITRPVGYPVHPQFIEKYKYLQSKISSVPVLIKLRNAFVELILYDIGPNYPDTNRFFTFLLMPKTKNQMKGTGTTHLF